MQADNESRSWHGWHRHVSLVMLAFAMMAGIQHQANKPTPKKTKSSATPRHPISSLGRSRKSAAQLNVSRENAFNPPMSSHGRSGGALIRPQHRNLISNKNHNCNASPRNHELLMHSHLFAAARGLLASGEQVIGAALKFTSL